MTFYTRLLALTLLPLGMLSVAGMVVWGLQYSRKYGRDAVLMQWVRNRAFALVLWCVLGCHGLLSDVHIDTVPRHCIGYMYAY